MFGNIYMLPLLCILAAILILMFSIVFFLGEVVGAKREYRRHIPVDAQFDRLYNMLQFSINVGTQSATSISNILERIEDSIRALPAGAAAIAFDQLKDEMKKLQSKRKS